MRVNLKTHWVGQGHQFSAGVHEVPDTVAGYLLGAGIADHIEDALENDLVETTQEQPIEEISDTDLVAKPRKRKE
jgi:hypothetical protein